MAGPWEKYGQAEQPAQEQAAGPWSKYKSAGEKITTLPAVKAAPPDFSGVTASVDSTASEAPGSMRLSGMSGPGVSAEEFAAGNRERQARFDPRTAAAADLSNRQKSFQDAPIAAQAAAGAGSRVALTGMGLGQLLGITDQQDAAKQREQMRVLEGSGAATVGGVAGDIGLLAAPGGAVGRLPTLTARIGGNALLGAAYGARAPTVEGESRIQNSLIGGAAGGVGGAAQGLLAGAATRAAAAVDPVKQAAIQMLRNRGIPLHVSQVSDSVPVKAMAGMAKYLPFSGSGRAAQNQQQAFNRAVGQTFGADAPQLTDDVVRNQRQALSRGFEAIYNRNDIPLTNQDLTNLANISNAAGRRLTLDEGAVVNNQLDDILAELNQAGVLTGQKYQALRTQIMRAEGPDRLGQAVATLRRELDDIAARGVGPNDAQALRQLRGQWANLRTTENALRQVAGAGGNVKPASLWPLIRNGSTAEMRDLARAGQVVLKDPIPDSGTPGRLVGGTLLTGGGLTGGAAALPPLAALLAGGATVGRALNSNALAALLADRVPGTGLNALARLAPGVGILAAPAVAAKPKRRLDNDAP